MESGIKLIRALIESQIFNKNNASFVVDCILFMSKVDFKNFFSTKTT